MSKSLDDVKDSYLNKFYVVAEKENSIPTLGHNPENIFNSIHIDFSNVLLKAGLSDLQIGFFRTVLDDVCIASKIKEHASLEATSLSKKNYAEEYHEIQEELAFLVKMLENMDIKDLAFEGSNENNWLIFVENFYGNIKRHYIICNDIPNYYCLTKNFLNCYLRCANAFHIMLYRKAKALASSDVINVNPEDEEAIFYMETHNFLMEVLRRFGLLNFNYNKNIDYDLIREIEFYSKLLDLVTVIFDETITDEQKKEFVNLIHNSSIAFLNFGSYFRKWLYMRAAAYEENLSR